jgi:hypothetical protein
MEIKEVLAVVREIRSTSNSNPIAKQKLARRRDGKGCQTGAGAMLKTVYAIAVAAIVAACFVLLPSLSPQVDAAVPAASGKSDRADTRPLAKDCSQSAWPYYEAACLRDARNTFGQAREVRFVPMDNMQHVAGATTVAQR